MDQPILKPRGRHSKGMYILPSLFTTANMAMGYYAILQVMHATANEFWHLDNAAKAIGFAVLFDGLDGRIARMTGTSSEFGKELDSLADVITFGVAPAILAWSWGFNLMPTVVLTEWHIKLTQLGAIASFLFLMAGAFQYYEQSPAVESRPSGQEIFCGHAHSGWCGCHCRNGSLHRWRSSGVLVHGTDLARDGRDSRLPDGQHVALLQL